MSTFWTDPALFDPERFAPELPRRRYRYSYFPFGGGPHQCLGQYLFQLEAQLIVSTVLSRFRFRLREPADLTPRMGASLRPEAARRGHPHPGRASGRIVMADPASGSGRSGRGRRAGPGLRARRARHTRPARTSPPPTLSCSTAAPFDPALLSSVATAIAFIAPWHTAAELRITNRAVLWVFAADWQVDYLARSVRRRPAGGEATASRWPTARAPTGGDTWPGCWPTCATNWPPCPRSPGCVRSGATSWRRMLAAVAREWDWKNLPTDPTTGRAAHLDRVPGQRGQLRLLLRQRHALDPTGDEKTLAQFDRPAGRRTRRAAGAAAGQRPRHATKRDAEWGDLNALSLVDDPAQVHDAARRADRPVPGATWPPSPSGPARRRRTTSTGRSASPAASTSCRTSGASAMSDCATRVPPTPRPAPPGRHRPPRSPTPPAS